MQLIVGITGITTVNLTPLFKPPAFQNSDWQIDTFLENNFCDMINLRFAEQIYFPYLKKNDASQWSSQNTG